MYKRKKLVKYNNDNYTPSFKAKINRFRTEQHSRIFKDTQAELHI